MSAFGVCSVCGVTTHRNPRTKQPPLFCTSRSPSTGEILAHRYHSAASRIIILSSAPPLAIRPFGIRLDRTSEVVPSYGYYSPTFIIYPLGYLLSKLKEGGAQFSSLIRLSPERTCQAAHLVLLSCYLSLEACMGQYQEGHPE